MNFLNYKSQSHPNQDPCQQIFQVLAKGRKYHIITRLAAKNRKKKPGIVLTFHRNISSLPPITRTRRLLRSCHFCISRETKQHFKKHLKVSIVGRLFLPLSVHEVFRPLFSKGGATTLGLCSFAGSQSVALSNGSSVENASASNPQAAGDSTSQFLGVRSRTAGWLVGWVSDLGGSKMIG